MENAMQLERNITRIEEYLDCEKGFIYPTTPAMNVHCIGTALVLAPRLNQLGKWYVYPAGLGNVAFELDTVNLNIHVIVTPLEYEVEVEVKEIGEHGLDRFIEGAEEYRTFQSGNSVLRYLSRKLS